MAMISMNNLLNGKDSRWLQLEVCREFQRNRCTRQDTECKFAHPPANVEVQNGKVTACYDSIKVGCVCILYMLLALWTLYFFLILIFYWNQEMCFLFYGTFSNWFPENARKHTSKLLSYLLVKLWNSVSFLYVFCTSWNLVWFWWNQWFLITYKHLLLAFARYSSCNFIFSNEVR